jgi:hypothetical protein
MAYLRKGGHEMPRNRKSTPEPRPRPGPKPEVEQKEIRSHSVQIRRQEGREELWIDGVRRRFFVTDDGYNLSDDAYARPQKTLLDAVEHWFERYPEEADRSEKAE